ncbi:MAG: peptidylprolyl isomerase [Rhodobacteraceae bacterium]|nr:peptidylprolyl isomerase [Paracoccaceae bacterium]
MRKLKTIIAACALLIGALPALPVAAQSEFSAVITVNGRAITGYELDQRIKFLTVLRAPGDIPAQAEQALIEDRVRLDAARRAGITVKPEQIQAGVAEFAARANLTPEEFVKAIGEAGVAPETFRDFVAAGIIWREVVRARFGNRVTVTEAEIDRAMSVTMRRGAGPRVLVSEIVMPAAQTEMQRTGRRAEKLIAEIRGEADFARLAQAVSAAPSRVDGGRLGWMPLTNLPPAARQAVMQSGQGSITPPVAVPGGIAFFLVRGLSEGGDILPGNVTVDYAQLLIPGGRSPQALAEAERIRARVDTCDDLYTIARGRGVGEVTREIRTLPQVPGDIAAELANLDEGEASTALTRGGSLVFLMLCTRTAVLAEGTGLRPRGGTAVEQPPPAPVAEGMDPPPRINADLGFGPGPTRDIVRSELVNQKLNKLSEGYLAELVADAVITRP